MTPIPVSWLLLAVLIALGAAGGAGYWKGGQHMRDRIEAQAAKEQEIRDETRRLAMEAAAKAISQIENRTIVQRQKVETITREVPIYSECRHSPDGLQLLNSALTGTKEPTDRSRLPDADTPDG